MSIRNMTVEEEAQAMKIVEAFSRLGSFLWGTKLGVFIFVTAILGINFVATSFLMVWVIPVVRAWLLPIVSSFLPMK